MIPEHTILAVSAVAGIVLAELAWLRTGIFRRRCYWVTVAVMAVLLAIVGGRLTRLPHAVVIHDPAEIVGARFPWDVPIEDHLRALSLVTLTILLWERASRSHRDSR